MSADDFQSKYASVMESMLKSAVAETTKLFETMVDELKAEISRIKKENEDLKTRCSQFESARSQPTADTGDSEPPPGASDGSEKRDTAVQCDLVPFRTMLIEQCQPLQNQQCGYEELEYALQEHDYDTRGEGNSQLAFIVVKQEAVLKQEEIESSVVCGQVLRNKTDSPWASPCPIENEGPFINKVCSTRDMPLSQRHEESQVTQEPPFSGTCSGAQNQSSESEHSLVISLAAIKDDVEEESEVSQRISENGRQGGLVTSEKQQLVIDQSGVEPLEKEQPSVLPQHCQRQGEISVNEQTDVTLQQHADVLSTQEQLAQQKKVTEVEANSQPDLPVRRRRGRPPKKAKRLKQPVKEKLQSPSSDTPSGQEEKKSPSSRVEEMEVSFLADTVHIASPESPQTCPVQPKESESIITPSMQERAKTALEDAENRKVGSRAVASLSRRRSSKKEKTSESQQLSRDMEEGATIQASSNEVSSAVEPPQAPSAQARERCTSVTLQDAMLLIEAMNQSTAEDTASSPQRTAAAPQTRSATSVATMQTVDEVPAEAQTPLIPGETGKAVGSLPLTELSTTTQSTIETLSAPLKAKDATQTSEAQAHIKVAVTKQQHRVPLSNTTKSSLPLSTAATQTSVQSFQQHPPQPLITSAAPSRQGNTVSHKIIVVPRSVSSLKPHKVAVQSTAQLPTVLSTVVVSQNKSILPRTTAAGIPAGTPSLSSVPQKTIYVSSSKLLPVVTQSTATSTDPQSGTPLNPKMTIIIPRQMSAVASMKQKSQTGVLTAQQESDKSTAPVMVVMSSSQSSSLSQESSVSMDTQTAFDKVATVLSQKRDVTYDYLESPEQSASAPETIHAHTQTCSSLKISDGLVPASMSSTLPPGFEQNCSAVVRLTRLPFPVSTKESVMVSRLPKNGSSDSQPILKEGTAKEICMSPTEILSNMKDTQVSANTCEMSEEPNDVHEKASVSSENYTTLEDSFNSGYVQPSSPFEVSQPVFEKSTMTISTTEPSAVFSTAGEPTYNLGQEIIEEEEEKSAALIQLTSITSKDTSDPHLQMTKAQFLAQLAVSPVADDLNQASSDDSVDARASCAETSTSDKSLQKNSIIAQLRSHIKTHLQARRTEANSEPHTATETHNVRPKKPRLENDHPNDENATSERTPLRPKNTGAVEDVTYLKKTTNDPTPIGQRRSGLCKDGVSESSSVNSRRSKATSESPPLSPKKSSSGRDSVGSKNKNSTFVSPRRSISTKESANLKRLKNTSVSARRSSSTKHSATPKKMKNTSVTPRRSSSAKESATRKRTTNTSLSPQKNSSTTDGTSPKNTRTSGSPNNSKTASVRPEKTSPSRDGASPKITKSISVSPKTKGLSKNGTSPEISTNGPSSFCRRRCTLTKDCSTTKEIKRESNSFSPSTPTEGASATTTKSETDSPSVSWSQLARDGVSPRKTGEPTSVKKPRLIEDGTSPRMNLGVVHSSCQAVKKCTAKAVWTPPRVPASKMPPADGKRSVQLPVKKNTVLPGSPDRPVVYPPSVSLYPIPVKAPPVVSPLQPLSVIGWRLLKNQCGECGRVLSSSAALESHVSLHKGRRPFSCTLCGKRFPDSKALKRHGRVHRNGRIHICQQCGKGFVYRFSLTKHLQMVHGRLKPFVCQICEKGFFTKRDVEAHIRIHTGEKPFHCNLCEKKFARRVELNVHLRWHNGEKRHWCPYCGKGFLDFNNLKRHKYIHTGEKPHSCPHCPKSFTQSGHLKKHVKNVHKIQ